jgi:hypothetical protein
VVSRLHPRIRAARVLASALAAIACLLAPIASARAADHYASPSGTGETENCLNPAAPCSLVTALEPANSAAGDAVLLAPGTYEEEVETLEIPHSLTISGEPGEAAPLILIDGESFGWGFVATEPVTLRDLRIHAISNVYAAFDLEGWGNLVERVESTGSEFAGCDLFSGTIKDSLCRGGTARRKGTGLLADLGGAGAASATLNVSNVTAVGTAAALGGRVEGSSELTVDAVDTIAFVENDHPAGPELDGAYDVSAVGVGEAGSSIAIDLAHSNFNSSHISATEGTMSISSPSENGNQSALPAFVDVATGDFHEAVISPTLLAGDPGAVETGDLDLDRQARTITCEEEAGVDIGAYQLQECPASAE